MRPRKYFNGVTDASLNAFLVAGIPKTKKIVEVQVLPLGECVIKLKRGLRGSMGGLWNRSCKFPDKITLNEETRLLLIPVAFEDHGVERTDREKKLRVEFDHIALVAIKLQSIRIGEQSLWVAEPIYFDNTLAYPHYSFRPAFELSIQQRLMKFIKKAFKEALPGVKWSRLKRNAMARRHSTPFHQVENGCGIVLAWLVKKLCTQSLTVEQLLNITLTSDKELKVLSYHTCFKGLYEDL